MWEQTEEEISVDDYFIISQAQLSPGGCLRLQMTHSKSHG